jgi:hypothetical protein
MMSLLRALAHAMCLAGDYGMRETGGAVYRDPTTIPPVSHLGTRNHTFCFFVTVFESWHNRWSAWRERSAVV